MKEIEKILIYRVGNLGDIVCAMPAMVAVRRYFPQVWIGLLTNKEVAGNPDPEKILKGNDFLDDIITYNPEKLREPRYLLSFCQRLRALQPVNLLIYLSLSKRTRPYLIRDWLFFRLMGFRKLIGFKLPKPAATCMRNGIKLPVFPQEADRLMSLLTPLGVNHTEIDFRLPINERDRCFVDAIWKDYNLRDVNRIIAICPGAKFPSKRWETARFARVACILQEQFDAKILLIGGPSERASGEEIIRKAGNSIVNLIGRTNYMESAEVIRRCNLLVSNDCGPVHLAAAVGTPVVGIYSSRDFLGAWHPWGNNHTILRNDSFSCRFCLRTECETMQCINSITVEQVIEACQGYLI